MSDGKIHFDALPEEVTETAPLHGFLSEYWKSGSALPRIRGLGIPLYFLKRGVANLIALPGSTAISILSIALSLFIFAGVLLVLANVSGVLKRLGSTLSVVAYIRADTPENVITEFVRELESNPRVRSVRYVSKESALEQLREQFSQGSAPGQGLDVLRGLDFRNPLPASLDVVLQSDDIGLGSEGDVLRSIRDRPFVEEISSGVEWVQKIATVVKQFRATSFLVLGIVLALVVTLIGNTIKLVLYLREDEISVMQLVGASDGFVRIPFILAGILQGAIGGVLSLLCLRFVFSLMSGSVTDSNFFGIVLSPPSFLTLGEIWIVLFLAMIVGAVGSFIAVGRFLKE